MHSVIFTVEGFDAIGLANYAKKVQTKVRIWPPKDIISENSWVLNLRTDLETLSWLIVFLEDTEGGYKILALDDEPEWIVGPRRQP
jgi:hypothetical protein